MIVKKYDFISDNNHGKYISEARPSRVKPGNFVDKEGNVLGKHKGIVYYTIGQRKGAWVITWKTSICYWD